MENSIPEKASLKLWRITCFDPNLFHILVRGDVRVIRGCGYIKDEKWEERDCYTTVLEEYNTEVCSCYDDGCNSAGM